METAGLIEKLTAICGSEAVAQFFAGLAGVGLLYEPVFYWPDTLYEFHNRNMPHYLAGNLPKYSKNLEARITVGAFTDAFNASVHSHGGTHIQIGRLYSYAQNREEGAGQLLRNLKNTLDPDNVINPEALGL